MTDHWIFSSCANRKQAAHHHPLSSINWIYIWYKLKSEESAWSLEKSTILSKENYPIEKSGGVEELKFLWYDRGSENVWITALS